MKMHGSSIGKPSFGNPVLLLTGALALLLSYSVARLPEQTVHHLTAEDGLYENFGAAFFLVTGLIFSIGFISSAGNQTFLFLNVRRNYSFLLLGLLFLFIFGEEISWGQRIFGIEPGGFFIEENLQQETNLHNLRVFNSVDEQSIKREWWDWFSMSRLFRLFWFIWCLVLPLLILLTTQPAKQIKRAGIPEVPIGFGVLLLANYFIFKILESNLNPLCEVVEIEECVTAFLLLTIAAQVVLVKKQSFRHTHLLHATNPIPSANR